MKKAKYPSLLRNIWSYQNKDLNKFFLFRPLLRGGGGGPIDIFIVENCDWYHQKNCCYLIKIFSFFKR